MDTAEKVRLGLDLVEATPPTRLGAVEEVVVALVGNGLEVDDLAPFKAMAGQLLWVADRHRIGPRAPRATVAGAAAHRAGMQLGYKPRFEGPSSPEMAEAVRAVVETSQK